jgi:WD40 repeat protein/TPR repeat protein
VVDLFNGQTRPLPSQSGDVTVLAFSSDGKQLLAASNAMPDVRIWRADDLSLQTVLRFSDAPQQDLKFLPNGSVMTWSAMFLSVWSKDDIKDRRRQMIAETPILKAASLLMLDESNTLVAGKFPKEAAVVVWNLEHKDQPPTPLIGHHGGVMSVRFSVGGTHVITASTDRSAILWDSKSGVLRQRFVGHGAELQDARFLKDGKRILTSSRDGTARVWNIENGDQLVRMDGKSAFSDVKVGSDDSVVVGLNDTDDLLIWRTADGMLVRTIKTPALVGAFAVTPDGDKLIATFTSGTLIGTTIVYAMNDGAEIKRISVHTAKVNDIEFSKNGKRMLTTSIDGLAVVWDLDTLTVVSTLQTETRGIWGGELDDAGKRAFVGGDDGTMMVWRPDTKVILLRAGLGDIDPMRVSLNWEKGHMLILGASGIGEEIGFETLSDRLAGTSDASAARQMTLAYARVVAAGRIETVPSEQSTGKEADGADDCDRLAAQPFDPAKKASGLPAEKIDVVAAEAACRKAIEGAPREPRFWYQLGRVLYKEKRDAEAIGAFLRAIDKQYGMAKVALYTAYDENRAPGRTDQDALRLLREALDQGVAVAGELLANAYWSGQHVTADKEQAVQLYRRAAALGGPGALRKLSELYEAGEIVPRDENKALYYQILAADRREKLGLDDRDQIFRRSALARRSDPVAVATSGKALWELLAPA